jgi:hypothetical protein
MTHPLRILFHGATIISLALCIACAALWLRSYFVSDALTWRWLDGPNSFDTASVHSCSGRIGIDGWSTWIDPGNPPQQGLSLRSGASFWLPPGWNPQATIPHWHLVIYSGALPLWWCVRRYLSLPALQNRRRKRGLCAGCGYDLRASPDQCPECGAIPRGMLTRT